MSQVQGSQEEKERAQGRCQQGEPHDVSGVLEAVHSLCGRRGGLSRQSRTRESSFQGGRGRRGSLIGAAEGSQAMLEPKGKEPEFEVDTRLHRDNGCLSMS